MSYRSCSALDAQPFAIGWQARLLVKDLAKLPMQSPKVGAYPSNR